MIANFIPSPWHNGHVLVNLVRLSQVQVSVKTFSPNVLEIMNNCIKIIIRARYNRELRVKHIEMTTQLKDIFALIPPNVVSF